MKTIAIVEDDIDDQDFVCQAFEKMHAGYLLKIFSNGLEFLDYIRDADQFPDVVITDLRMPLVTGWELISDLKNNQQTKHIPVAVLSTSANKADKDKAIQLGACVYQIKPHTADGYLKIVESIVSHCNT